MERDPRLIQEVKVDVGHSALHAAAYTDCCDHLYHLAALVYSIHLYCDMDV